MFTVGETRTISDANKREEETQLRRSENGDLKFSEGKEEEDDEKKPQSRENIAQPRLDCQPSCAPAFLRAHHGWITGLRQSETSRFVQASL